MAESWRPSTPPLPLTKDPEDNEDGTRELHLRTMFSKWLVEIKDVFDSWFNRTYIGEWTPPPPPMTLFHEIYKNCASRLEKPEFDEISVLIKYSNDVAYVPLILMRMAQLDLAGDDDYARNYVPTLKWSSERHGNSSLTRGTAWTVSNPS